MASECRLVGFASGRAHTQYMWYLYQIFLKETKNSATQIEIGFDLSFSSCSSDLSVLWWKKRRKKTYRIKELLEHLTLEATQKAIRIKLNFR